MKLYVLAASIVVALSASPLFLGQSDHLSGLAKAPALLLSLFPGVRCSKVEESIHEVSEARPTEQLLLQAPDLQRVTVLFVLDPNFYLCWESIKNDETINRGFLKWITTLKDEFSTMSGDPQGHDLKVIRHHPTTLHAAGTCRYSAVIGLWLELQ